MWSADVGPVRRMGVPFPLSSQDCIVICNPDPFAEVSRGRDFEGDWNGGFQERITEEDFISLLIHLNAFTKESREMAADAYHESQEQGCCCRLCSSCIPCCCCSNFEQRWKDFIVQHEAEVEEFCQKATVHLLSRGLMLEARREKLELAVPLGGPGPTFIKQFVFLRKVDFPTSDHKPATPPRTRTSGASTPPTRGTSLDQIRSVQQPTPTLPGQVVNMSQSDFMVRRMGEDLGPTAPQRSPADSWSAHSTNSPEPELASDARPS